MDLQTNLLENEWLKLLPLDPGDYDALYRVASDPLIWEQHPNKERYREAVFRGFFAEALKSGGAFLITDKKTGAVIGSSRYYEYDSANSSVAIGYTFLARHCWGKLYNTRLKTLMLEYAFRHVDTVIFHVGVNNIRSQKAIERIGAEKINLKAVQYAGEPAETPNFVYQVTKEAWRNRIVNQV